MHKFKQLASSFLTIALLFGSLQIYGHGNAINKRQYIKSALKMGCGVTLCVLTPLLEWQHYKKIKSFKRIVGTRRYRTNADQKRVLDQEMDRVYRHFDAYLPIPSFFLFSLGLQLIMAGKDEFDKIK